jgi:hypothetical protein
MTSSSILSVVLGQTDPAAGILSGPIASEVGLLLLIGAIGFIGGFGLRWFWRCVRTLVLVILVVAVALWLAGIGLRPTGTAPAGLLPSAHGAGETLQALVAAPLRAGVGAVGFVFGMLAARGSRGRRDSE